MLPCTVGANLLGNILAIAKIQGRRIVRAGYGNKKRSRNYKSKSWKQNRFLMPPHPLTNFGVYSRDNLSKIKDEAYVINLDEYSNIGTHWIALYIHNNDVTYFDSFGVEHIPKEIKAFINNKNIKTNIFRIQAYDSIMCGYFCIGFIDFMLAGKTLTEFRNIFPPNNFKENDDIIVNYFMSNV